MLPNECMMILDNHDNGWMIIQRGAFRIRMKTDSKIASECGNKQEQEAASRTAQIRQEIKMRIDND
jgi:hypothetical protein